ncbi:MAG: hypothetical protein WDZ59_08985 [Pirellulales bacterium]
MTDAPHSDATRRIRYAAYTLLIAVAVGNMTGRLMAVNSVDLVRLEAYRINDALSETRRELESEGVSGEQLERRLEERRAELEQKLRLQRPFLSSNDRSRWAAVRALVEHGTFAIDQIVAEPGWDTIDMVKHKDRSGTPHLYSSKPPLLTVLIAAEYWVVHQLTGVTLGTHPYELGRLMLFTINIIPLALMFVLVVQLAERFGETDWGKLFVVAAASLATMLNTFAVVLNNHIVAAVSAAVALYTVVRIWCDDRPQRWHFVLCGLAAAFTAANELPALALFAAIGAGLLWRFPRLTLAAFTPAALLVVAAFFATNYVAHDSLRPPYMHRSEIDQDDNWYEYTYVRDGRERQSYWMDPAGIDRGEPSRAWYAMNVLVGHHGIFSLTPVWLLSVAGLVGWLLSGDIKRRDLALLIGSVSLVCLVFYLMRPQVDRNYGGMTSGFRWMYWFAPLWLVVMLPAADWLSRRRWARGLGLVLLAWSVMSVSYPTWNPWTHPWLTNLFIYLRWESF